jgi:hypothetical protein
MLQPDDRQRSTPHDFIEPAAVVLVIFISLKP